MFYVNKNHVPPRCKIAKFSIVKLEIAHGSSHSMFCKGKGSGLGRGARRCCRRQQNGQVCLPLNADFYKQLPKAADSMFAVAVNSYKIYAEGRRLTLTYPRKDKKKSKEFP